MSVSVRGMHPVDQLPGTGIQKLVKLPFRGHAAVEQ